MFHESFLNAPDREVDEFFEELSDHGKAAADRLLECVERVLEQLRADSFELETCLVLELLQLARVLLELALSALSCLQLRYRRPLTTLLCFRFYSLSLFAKPLSLALVASLELEDAPLLALKPPDLFFALRVLQQVLALILHKQIFVESMRFA